MSMPLKFCRICKSVRTLSPSQSIYRYVFSGETIPRPVDSTYKSLLLPSSVHFMRDEPFVHLFKRNIHSQSSSVTKKIKHAVDKKITGAVDVEDTTPDAIRTKPNIDEGEVDNTKQLYHSILESFPDGIQMAFAYGSGAIQQDHSKKSQNVLDFIFVVDHPSEWHQRNLKLHSNHYSFLKILGPKRLAKIQDSYGAGVYFNTLVPMQDRIIKYGVISTARLISDLLDWDSLYISGRLHKPVSIIILPTDELLLEALVVNLESAVHAALLLLPDTFTEVDLFLTIAGLSYNGDIRMGVAENKNKIRNIVLPNLWNFRRMYLPILMKQGRVLYWQDGGHMEQALCFESRRHHLTHLPYQVITRLAKQKGNQQVQDLEDQICVHAFDENCGESVNQSVKGIVKTSSASQTMKGILTAGPVKSIRYGWSKVKKRVLGS